MRYLILLIVLAMPVGVAAQGLDQSYVKDADRKPWSQRFVEYLGYDSGISKSYALVVGISDFEHYSDLPTEKDPLKVRDFLLGAGFDVVHVLTEEKVTLPRLRALMVDDFPSQMDANDRFVLYWSGHGVERDNTRGGQTGYLPLANSQQDRYSTMASMVNIENWDENLPGRHVLYLIDACFSGLAGVAKQSDQTQLLVDQMLKPARYLLTAGAAEEQTIASDQWGGSLFTHALLSGLSGAADTSTRDDPSDGVISLFELITHIKKRVTAERNRKGWDKAITPQLRDMRGSDGEFFFLSRPVQRVTPMVNTQTTDPSVVTQSGAALPAIDSSESGGDSSDEAVQKRIDVLIRRITDNVANLRLTTPTDDNANDLLMELEGLDPEHNAIGRSREEIRFIYARWIATALDQGDSEKANRYLASMARVPGSEHLVEQWRRMINQSTVPIPRSANFIAPEMVRIPAGSFMMGSNNGFDNEKPVREVSVPAFEMQRHELTWAEWEACENDGGCTEIKRPWERFANVPVSERPSHPVVYVDIDSVNDYLTWLNKQTGLVYRLPSEAEWEYAARAGSTTAYSWGNDIGKNQANCDGCGSQWDDQSTAPVGSFQPNALGLYDMHGNVFEWTWDCWHDNYKGAPTDGSAWVDECDESNWHPLRGGSWLGQPEVLRAAFRFRLDTANAYSGVGFRLARTLP